MRVFIMGHTSRAQYSLAERVKHVYQNTQESSLPAHPDIKYARVPKQLPGWFIAQKSYKLNKYFHLG